MCKYETSWEKPEEQCEWLYEAVTHLSEMEKDHLIELDPFHLIVKKSARPFIRNICMAFDARLWRNAPTSQLFSSIV